jgi:hypothetical protein
MMKIKMVNRPGKIVQREGTVIMVMETRKVPTLPGDLPTPPEGGVPYTVYIDEKQWKKVAGVVENPQDALVIEGYCFYDAELKGLAVLAQNVVSKLGQSLTAQRNVLMSL